MEKITTRDRILGVANAWKEQYKSEIGCNTDKDIIYKNLQKLNLNTVTVQDIVSTIGNDSWTMLVCDECKEEVETIIQLGDEPDYESSTANICIPCLKKALSLK
jgi:hypothetical protein